MGWNKQSGENWELSRTVMHTDGQHDPVKALRLAVNGILTIDDAQKLCGALAAEVQAAAKSEGHTAAILQHWDDVLQPWQKEVVEALARRHAMSQQGHAAEKLVDAVGRPLCHRCETLIHLGQTRLGEPRRDTIVWEHVQNECPHAYKNPLGSWDGPCVTCGHEREYVAHQRV